MVNIKNLDSVVLSEHIDKVKEYISGLEMIYNTEDIENKNLQRFVNLPYEEKLLYGLLVLFPKREVADILGVTGAFCWYKQNELQAKIEGKSEYIRNGKINKIKKQ